MSVAAMNTISEDTQPGVKEALVSNSEPNDVENMYLSLGAAIPEELFPNILSWIRQDYYASRIAARAQNVHQWYASVSQDAQLRATSTIRNCALVSRYWATQCRRYMFSGMTVHISSLEHAKLFREYALHGSPHLPKVCDLIKELRIRQSYYDTPRSFLDLVYLPSTRHKLWQVELTGPPDDFPLIRLDTPHWTVSNTADPSPLTTAYREVSLRGFTFPSFLYLVKYMKHFRAAHSIDLSNVRWNDKLPLTLPRPIPVFSRRRSISVTATRCTDSFVVGWYVFAMYADSPVHGALLERDQQWAMDAMLFLRNYYEAFNDDSYASVYVFTGASSRSDKMPTFGVDVSRNHHISVRTKIEFICDSHPRSLELRIGGPNSPRPTRIVGVLLTITARRHVGQRGPPRAQHTPEFSRLWRDLEQRCALRVVCVVFDAYAVLKSVVQRNFVLKRPWPNGCDYRLACKRDLENRFPDVSVDGVTDIAATPYVGIDPATLEPTGECWGDSFDFVSSLLTGAR